MDVAVISSVGVSVISRVEVPVISSVDVVVNVCVDWAAVAEVEAQAVGVVCWNVFCLAANVDSKNNITKPTSSGLL